MKLVLAIVQPYTLDDITRQLERIPRFSGMTVGDVRGFGREHADRAPPGAEGTLADFAEKVQIETVAQDDQVDAVVAAIARAAHTGRYGDGMIFVLPVERALRIATMQEGHEVL